MKHLAFAILVGSCLQVANDLVHTADGTKTVAQGSSARQTIAQKLSRAVTLFATDDDRPEAEQLFLQVIKTAPVTTSDGATARYYLGRLYHRNYYMLGQKNGLNLAADRYKEVHNRGLGLERGGAWYAEARFYKSLAYMEQGEWDEAYEAIVNMEPSLDPELNIDYLIWAADNRPVNRRVPTDSFKKRCLDLLKKRAVNTHRDGTDKKTFNAVLTDLQSMLERWGATRSWF